MKKRLIPIATATAALCLALTPPALAAQKSGTATCPALVVGGISAYSIQGVRTQFMYLSVGTQEVAGFGQTRFDLDTNLKTAFWYASSNSLQSAKGYCMPG